MIEYTDTGVHPPEKPDLLTRLFNTPAKREALNSAISLSKPVLLATATLTAIAGMSAVAAPTAAMALLAITKLKHTRTSPYSPVHILDGNFSTTRTFIAATAVAALTYQVIEGVKAGDRKERAALMAVQPFTAESVTIPARTLTAHQYFCGGIQAGIVTRRLPNNGPLYRYDCAVK